MRILNIIPTIEIVQGGPTYSTTNLCRALAAEGADVTLFTTYPTGPQPPALGQDYEVRFFQPSFPRRFQNSAPLIAALKTCAPDYDIIHLHNLWNFTTTAAARVAWRSKVPYIITPRGMLSAFNHTARKFHKQLYYRFAERHTLARAALVHLLTPEEQTMSAGFLNGQPTTIIGNGIWPEEFQNLNAQAFRRRFGLADHPLVLFLGRLHPIKRLDLQCRAFQLLADTLPNLRWVFVGPDAGMADHITATLKKANLLDRTILTGPLLGADRLNALAAANVYCHSSAHEGHSVAITEALAAGRPTVVTDSCNFAAIAAAQAGFVVDSNPQAIAGAIKQILTDSKLAQTLSTNAAALAADRFNWSQTARKMLQAYQRVLQ